MQHVWQPAHPATPSPHPTRCAPRSPVRTPFTGLALLPPRYFESLLSSMGPARAAAYLATSDEREFGFDSQGLICSASTATLQRLHARLRAAAEEEAERGGRPLVFACPSAASVHALQRPDANAVCMAGGIIVIHSGLISDVQVGPACMLARAAGCQRCCSTSTQLAASDRSFLPAVLSVPAGPGRQPGVCSWARDGARAGAAHVSGEKGAAEGHMQWCSNALPNPPLPLCLAVWQPGEADVLGARRACCANHDGAGGAPAAGACCQAAGQP